MHVTRVWGATIPVNSCAQEYVIQPCNAIRGCCCGVQIVRCKVEIVPISRQSLKYERGKCGNFSGACYIDVVIVIELEEASFSCNYMELL